MLTVQELISLRTEMFSKKKVKLVRHQDSRYEYRDIIKDREKLLNYQRKQSKNVFGKTDYLVSFIGQEGTKSLLFGIFKVMGVEKKEDHFYYDLEEIHLCPEFIDRVVIEWGRATRSWHQDYNIYAKEIIEILPKGYLGTFPGLTNFILDFQELKKLIFNSDANRDWYSNLSSVNGIYMILDTITGNQYIGSACGKKGIWQRWLEYSKTKHGGNKALANLLEVDSNYCNNFQFTVLQTLPSNILSKDVVSLEAMYKKKLGSRVHGLNSN